MTSEKSNGPGSLGNTTRKVEVFRPGTFTAMNGQAYTFSSDDIAGMVAGYDEVAAPAPVVVGHPKHDDPAFGWAESFEVNEAGTLVANLKKLDPEFVSAVTEGRYRKISMKFFPPDASNNPTPGQYYPRHIGFLGGAAPAVSGLAPVQFSDENDDELIEVIAFSLEEATASTASIMRRVREFFIAQFGLEAADQAVPEYYIRWIEESGKTPEADPEPGFSDPQPKPKTKEPSMSTEDETKLNERAAALDKRERDLRRTEHVSFADGLVDAGKLLPVQKDSVIALLGELAGLTETEIAFSDDGTEKKTAPAQLLQDILSAQPEVVPDGQTDLGEKPAAKSIAFAAPDNLQVDTADLEIHQKAVAFQSKNPGIEYIDAVSVVQGG